MAAKSTRATNPEAAQRGSAACRTPRARPNRSETLATNSRGHTVHQTRPRSTVAIIIPGHHRPQTSSVTRCDLANTLSGTPAGVVWPQPITTSARSIASINPWKR